MNNIMYILLGWFLGLLGPTIINKIKSDYSKQEFFDALCAELHDLQFRMAITSNLLAQQLGALDKDLLTWMKPIIQGYRGDEPKEQIAKAVDALLQADDAEFKTTVDFMRAKEDVGLSLKTFSLSFLESHSPELSKLPIPLQFKIHEFKNQFNSLNQEIVKANERLIMTYDASISKDNHIRLKKDLLNKYADIQKMCRRVADKIETVISEKITK